jgi:hypothetical protein
LLPPDFASSRDGGSSVLQIVYSYKLIRAGVFSLAARNENGRRWAAGRFDESLLPSDYDDDIERDSGMICQSADRPTMM